MTSRELMETSSGNINFTIEGQSLSRPSIGKHNSTSLNGGNKKL